MDVLLRDLILQGRQNLKQGTFGGTWSYEWIQGPRFMEDLFSCAIPMPRFLNIVLVCLQAHNHKIDQEIIHLLEDPSFIQQMTERASHVYIPEIMMERKKMVDRMITTKQDYETIRISMRALYRDFFQLFWGTPRTK